MNFRHLQAALLSFLVVSLLVLGVFWLRQKSSSGSPEPKVAAVFEGAEVKPDFKADLKNRQVFPFSVVPGGTLSKEEVIEKVKTDKTVAEHYKGIDVNKLFTIQLKKPVQGYVSYRVGNRIFWTSQRLYLKAGELLLTDGNHIIRGRCGNRVSLVPVGRCVRASEPTVAQFDRPIWDGPVFQAMVAEAMTGRDSLSMELPPNLVAEVPMLKRDIPDTVFALMPGPGVIGGSLPGGLPSGGTGGSAPVVSNGSNFFVFPVQTPVGTVLPIGTIDTPVTIATAFPGPSSPFVRDVTSGGPVFVPGPTPPGFPSFPPGLTPPTFFPPTVTVVPPIVVPPGTPTSTPPDGPPGNPPGNPPTNPPGNPPGNPPSNPPGNPPGTPPDGPPPTTPPPTVPPPDGPPPTTPESPVPEPGSILLVVGALGAFALMRRRA